MLPKYSKIINSPQINNPLYFICNLEGFRNIWLISNVLIDMKIILKTRIKIKRVVNII